MKSKKKFKKTFSPVQLAGFLKQLAAWIEGSPSGDDGQWAEVFENFDELALKLKCKASGYSVKVKIEQNISVGSHEAAEAVRQAAVKYKHGEFKDLKKRMKSSFKAIRESLSTGSPPDRAVVAEFLADSDNMADYPGCSDEYYSLFIEACARFSTACGAPDLETIRSRFEELKRRRDECHARYK